MLGKLVKTPFSLSGVPRGLSVLELKEVTLSLGQERDQTTMLLHGARLVVKRNLDEAVFGVALRQNKLLVERGRHGELDRQ